MRSIYADGADNPTNWYNGSSYTNLTWAKGRQLSSLTKGTTNISYAYDMDGIRKSKTVGNEQHTYLTESGKVMRETIGTGSTAKILDFVYDDKGLPFALLYYPNSNSTSPAIYYYITNMQGDVVRLVNSTGATAAAYTYDAWGNVSVTDYYTFQIGELNPIRYRGYYYDRDTGWYYLQSRYYDPEVGRFINADAFLSTNGSLQGYNSFAYCEDNPVNYYDQTGTFAISASLIACGLIVAGLCGLDNGLCAYLDGGSFWKGFAIGAVTGIIGFATCCLVPELIPSVNTFALSLEARTGSSFLCNLLTPIIANDRPLSWELLFMSCFDTCYDFMISGAFYCFCGSDIVCTLFDGCVDVGQNRLYSCNASMSTPTPIPRPTGYNENSRGYPVSYSPYNYNCYRENKKGYPCSYSKAYY